MEAHGICSSFGVGERGDERGLRDVGASVLKAKNSSASSTSCRRVPGGSSAPTRRNRTGRRSEQFAVPISASSNALSQRVLLAAHGLAFARDLRAGLAGTAAVPSFDQTGRRAGRVVRQVVAQRERGDVVLAPLALDHLGRQSRRPRAAPWSAMSRWRASAASLRCLLALGVSAAMLVGACVLLGGDGFQPLALDALGLGDRGLRLALRLEVRWPMRRRPRARRSCVRISAATFAQRPAAISRSSSWI